MTPSAKPQGLITLRSHLQSINLKVLTLAMALLLILILATNSWLQFKSHIENGQSRIDALQENLIASLSFNDEKVATDTLKTLTYFPDVLNAEVFSNEAKTFARYESIKGYIPPRLDPILDGYIFDIRGVTFHRSLRLDGKLLGWIVQHTSLESLYRQLVLEILLALMALSFSLFLAMFWQAKLLNKVTTPLMQLEKTMKQIFNEELAQFAEPSDIEELDVLGRGFNIMLEKISQRDRKLLNQTETLEQQVKERTSELHKAVVKAEAASMAKSQFLSNMSHEIRTPMSGVLGIAELLQLTTLDEAQQLYVDAIDKSGRHLLKIISDILDFSKIESGHIELETIQFDLNEFVKNTATAFTPSAHVKGLDFVVNVPAGEGMTVHGDPTRLRQILDNLIGNAVKFTMHGEIKLALEINEVKTEFLTFSLIVADTGIGIPLDAQEYIFEYFSQADDSTTRKFGGTGIGLAIARNLARLMGGDISIKSHHGIGSEFRVNLKLPRSEEKITLSTQVISRQLGGKVLLIEDVEVNQILGLAMLKIMGIEARAVGDAREAFEIIRSRGVDLVLMDCQMPNIDGYAATQFIRSFEANSGLTRIPIIALTANAISGDREKCLAAGMDDYLSKPYSLKQLSAMLSRWLPEISKPKIRAVNSKVFALSELNIPSTGTTPINHSILEKVRAIDPDNGNALIHRLITAYIKHAQPTLLQLDQALADNDVKRLGQVAHALKSSSFSVGAEYLGDLLKKIDSLGTTHNEQSSVALVQAVHIEYERVRESLKAIQDAL